MEDLNSERAERPGRNITLEPILSWQKFKYRYNREVTSTSGEERERGSEVRIVAFRI